MNWKKINCETILNMFREIEKDSISLYGENSITYSDENEELKIIYRKLENKKQEVKG